MTAHLGTPGGRAGGTRAGRDGTCGPSMLPPGPGREGTGGAPKELGVGGGPGVGPLAAGGRLGTGAAAGGRCWDGGLEKNIKGMRGNL